MPDMPAPVADQIQPPSAQQGLSQLSSLLDYQRSRTALAQQQQNLQTGLYKQQQEQGLAQSEQEQMAERQKLQAQLQSGAFGDPNSDDYGSKVADWARGNLPLIGQDVAQKAIKTQSDKTQLRGEVADLQQKYRTGLGGVVASFVGNPAHPDQIDDAIDAYVKANPDAKGAAYHAKDLIDHLANVPDQGIRDQALNHLASELQGQPQLAAAQVDTGTQIQPGARPQFGVGFSPVGPPIGKTDIITLGNDQQARLNAATGKYELLTPTSTSSKSTTTKDTEALTADNDPMKPGPNDPDWRRTNYGALVTKAASDVQGAQTADANYRSNMETGDMIRQLSNKVNTGPKTKEWVNATGAIGSRIGAQNVADYQTLGSFLDLQAARLRDSMDLPATNAGLATAHTMGTDIESQRQAIQAKTDYYQALTELQHRYRTGLDAAGNNGVNSSPTAVNKFKSEFTANADPIAMELKLANDRGDSATVQRIFSQLSPAQRQQIIAHGRYLDKLMGE